MDGLAGAGQGFMNVEETELIVSYFSPANLKGAAISLAIGGVSSVPSGSSCGSLLSL